VSTEKRHEVIVAGAGPVGMVAALRLAQAGVEVLVLEQGADLSIDSKASTFHIPTLELLETLGVLDEMLERGLKAPIFQQRDRKGGILAELDLGQLADETPYPFRLQLEQSKLTRIIRPRLVALGNVELRYETHVDRAEDRGDHAAVFCNDSDEPLLCDWLIGAEGANSMVRQSLGFGFEGVTFPERFLVMSTTFEFADVFENLAHVAYITDPDEWLVLLRTPDHWRVLMPVPLEETSAGAVSDERIQQRLNSVLADIGRGPVEFNVIQHSLYNVHQRVASTFSQNRVLLAGDSAHMNNPLGGMGMNSGVHDGWSAVDTILAVRAGADPKAASELFGRVRAEVCHTYVQAQTTKNFQEMQEKDRETRERRNADIRAMVGDVERTKAYLRQVSMLTSGREAITRVQRELAAL
jgi:2-polyprenyl-6-methoxyphenol hydroxylase-like FAD-dependent oxidoreductase